MKVYGEISEGHRDIIAYVCDNCEGRVNEETLPRKWIIDNSSHYCPECQERCGICNKIYSVKYMTDYGQCENCADRIREDLFKIILCENCQEEN